MGPQASLLRGDRLHLNHGPIDLVIGADGNRARAFDAARTRFDTVLEELVAELPMLRRPLGVVPQGAIARTMYNAAHSYRDGVTTPMIAVAGAVADTVLAAILEAAHPTRAYVNNGGDIALHLTGQASFRIAVADPQGRVLGHVVIGAADGINGIATSGQKGRSLSLGIAEAVTVLAHTAALADAAATLIANAVDLPGHPAIRRTPACEVDENSDLGGVPVVRHVGPLTAGEVAAALRRGQERAEDLRKRGLIDGAALFLRDQNATVGLPHFTLQISKELHHA